MSYATLVLVAAVKGSVLLIAAWLAMRAFPRMSAALRHLVWTSALGSLVLMPLLIRVVPSVQWRVVPAIPVVTSIQTMQLVSSTPAASRSSVEVGRQARASESRSSVETPASSAGTSAPRHSINLERAFPIAWAVIALALLLRVGFGRLRLALLARNARVVDNGEWLLLAQRLAHRLDISRPITLLQSDRSCVPMTWGLIYPTVLLPIDADEWTDERRTIVLLHELAHVNRLDAFTQFVAQLATAIFWFNPFAWLAAHAMRIARELACDDCVLASGARPSDYAQDLLQIARTFSTRSDLAVAALAMARRGDLEDRLLAILDPATNRSTVSGSRLIAATLSILALSIPVAALSPTPVHAAERPTPSVDLHFASAPVTASSHAATDVAQKIERVVVAALPSMRATTPASHAARITAKLPLAMMPVITAPRVRGIEPDRETLISVAQAAVKLTSSFDKAELLVPIAKYYVADDELASAYVTAASSISADFDRARTFNALLSVRAPLGDKVVETAMNALAVRRMSDYEKRQVIVATTTDGRVLGPDARRAVIAAIATIGSSFDRRAAISTFVTRRQFNEQDAVGLIKAASTISGSFDRTEALVDIATHHRLDDAGVRQAYMKATESIGSSSDYRRAVQALVKRP
ncbi:MAG TPA: M56 family metallopeptidase [Gemmatimonadaceae bacterium]|jgi:beta-lactamase regulating signal transducer with metallopeptidase domain